MRYTVSCQCVNHPVAECPNLDDANGVVRRHHMLVGHNAQVERVLDTPFEGLVS